MPNVRKALNDGISRLSKKVVRAHARSIQVTSHKHRKQLAALKQQIHQLQRQVAVLSRAIKQSSSQSAGEEDTKSRFSAKGLRSLRNRLGLSAGDLAKLLEVSAQTVYNWEHKTTSPGPSQVKVIAGLRKIGKREAQARLNAMEST